MPSEADIQKAIVEALIWDGWMILRINQGGRHNLYPNTPDGYVGINKKNRYIRFAYWQTLGIDQQDSGISDVIAMKETLFGKRDNEDDSVETIYLFQLLAIEVKAPGKKSNVTDKQRAFLYAIEEHGGIAIVADSLEDIEPYLDRVIAQ